MSVPSLEFGSWLAPLDLTEFRRDVFGRSLHYTPPRLDLAEHLLGTLGIRAVDDAFALRGAKAYAWFQKRDGRHAAAPIPASSARRFYDAGTAIYLRRIREFASFDQEVGNNLGIPQSTIECSIFCNPEKAVTRAHFDRSDIFVVQLKGKKSWRTAPNRFAPMPLVSWGTLDPMTADVRLYAHGVPPSQMPDDASTYELEPGATLYLPRGYWHETTADEDSLSLHVTISSTTRIDVLIGALKNELARDAWWREPAYDLSTAEPSGIEEATAACAALREAAARLDPKDLVRMPIQPRTVEQDARFERCGQVSFGIDTLDPRTETARVTITCYAYREKKTTQLELSIEFVAACDWLNELVSGATFDIPAVLQAAPGLNEAEAKELLQVLEHARFVRRMN